MAQYYQIVGHQSSLTLEDLQRYCPNICLDSIIVNQEDQQYGQQQVSNVIKNKLNFIKRTLMTKTFRAETQNRLASPHGRP